MRLLFVTPAGPVRGLGVLSREHFEVNPEEIHVNFSDVKGVSCLLLLSAVNVKWNLKGRIHDCALCIDIEQSIKN